MLFSGSEPSRGVERRAQRLALGWLVVLAATDWLPDGGYAFTADDTPDVIVRMRGAHDELEKRVRERTPELEERNAQRVAYFKKTGRFIYNVDEIPAQ